MCVEALPIQYKDFDTNLKSESSASIRDRVMEARSIQLERYKNENIYFNSQLSSNMVKKYCKIGNEEKQVLEHYYEKLKLSARAYHRILKVSRTIADLDQTPNIKVKHLSEAIRYRTLDKKYWDNE